MDRPSKICVSCGRAFEWRKKWEACWDEVIYCSKRCRGQGVGEGGKGLERAILKLLDSRSGEATICPSEAARKVFGEDEWREQMEAARQAARRLVARGEIEITQKGRVVAPSTAKGPIRLKLVKRSRA